MKTIAQLHLLGSENSKKDGAAAGRQHAAHPEFLFAVVILHDARVGAVHPDKNTDGNILGIWAS